MTQSPHAARLAQTLTDLWYPDVDPEGDYPRLVVTLGDGRWGELVDVTYYVIDADHAALVLHVEEDGPSPDQLADVVAALRALDAVVAEAVARDEADDAPAYHTARAVRSWRDALLRRLTEEDM